MSNGIEISDLNLEEAYEFLCCETDKVKRAYYWGYAHCLQALHKKGYFSKDAMEIDDFFLEALKE